MASPPATRGRATKKEFLGLDQVNIGLPLSLMGSGQSQVTLTAAGLTSNTVLLDIQ
jgi:uncharacterized protein (TIGR03437 family)